MCMLACVWLVVELDTAQILLLFIGLTHGGITEITHQATMQSLSLHMAMQLDESHYP